MNKNETIIICESTDKGVDITLLKQLISLNYLLGQSGYNNYNIETRPPGDIQTVLDYINKTLPNQHNILSRETKTVLVIVDADENPNKRFNEIKNSFDRTIFEVQRSLRGRLPSSSTKINVGIFLFPNNHEKGSLETLCLKALKHKKLSKKLKCIDSYIDCIDSIDGRITQNNKSKSQFRIFMATPNPDAYVKSVLDCVDLDSTEFKGLKDFISQAKP